jgi:hypothetical protein
LKSASVSSPMEQLEIPESMSPVETNYEVAEQRRAAILLLRSARSRRNCFPASTAVWSC